MDLSILEEFLGNQCDGVLKVENTDVSEERDLGSINCDPLYCRDTEQVRLEERNIGVLRTSSVIRVLGERVQASDGHGYGSAQRVCRSG